MVKVKVTNNVNTFVRISGDSTVKNVHINSTFMEDVFELKGLLQVYKLSDTRVLVEYIK